ncbi:hypothetical protein L208DRAFT_1252513 [Tricholoma matsutake]|nr:hypothetical protein L208DRAFT_1252513 [Tricholoma matsutake 945]
MRSSRSQARSRSSRYSTRSPVPYISQPESLPDGPVGEEAGLLNEFVHHHHENTLAPADDEDDEDDDAEEAAARRRLPWWKRPSPWWLLSIVPLSAIATSACIAPRIEVYTLLACSVHKPEVFEKTLRLGGYAGFPTENSPHIVLPPVVLANSFDRSDPWFSPSVPVLDVQNVSYVTAQPNPCALDPVVQAAVATLTAGEFDTCTLDAFDASLRNQRFAGAYFVMAAVTGILSCLTTGWWGSFSDRHGRTRVLGVTVLGVLLNDFNLIFVTLLFRQLPGNYWFLLVGPIIEGCAGGITAASAAMHGYLADTTTESTRSRVFSLSLGLFFTGMTFGPTLGGLLIRFSGNALSVFYLAGLIHFLYACMVWLIVPESLSLRQMDLLHRKYVAESDGDRVHGITKRLFAFLSPLTLLMPGIGGEEQGNINPLKAKGRDWSLTLLSAAYGCTIFIMGAYTYTLQYAASTFGWTSETFGYFISFVGAIRAIFLTMILPFVIQMFKPKPAIVQLPVDPQPNQSSSPSSGTSSETQPLLVPASVTPPSLPSPLPNQDTKSRKALDLDSPHFDLVIARVSLFVDMASYALLSSVSTAVAFTLAVSIAAMGAGFNPAVQSVALGLYRRRGGTENGKLFGALSVLQALCSQIIGPAMYGLVYMKTVATFPRTIFIVSLLMVSISFVLLAFVRLPKEHCNRTFDLATSRDDDIEEEAEDELDGSRLGREETLVDIGGSGA